MPHRLVEAQDALARSQARLAFITDCAELGYWHWDVTADVLEWSPRCRALFGLDDDAPMTYARFVEAVHPDDRERAERAVRASLAGEAGGQFDAEFRTRWPDGTVRWIRSKGRTTFVNGVAASLAGVALDVTDRKHEREQLAADLEFMRRLQRLGTLVAREGELSRLLEEIIDTAIAATGAIAGHIRLLDGGGVPVLAAHRHLPAWWLDYWADVAARTGTTGLALARGARVVVADVETDPLFAGTPALEVQRRAGIRAVQATPLVTRDGRVLGTLSTHYGRPLHLDDRTAQRLDLLAREASDILEDVRAAAELRASERRFQAMADAAPAMLWVTEPDGTCTFLSQSWTDFTGQTRDQALGFGWLDAVHPDDRESASRVFLDANARGAPFTLDYRLRRADGEYRWAIDAGRPRHDERGAFAGYVGAVIDVHERKQAERGLRISEERFRSFMAHGPVAAWIVDEAGRIRYLSPGYTRLFGENGVREGGAIADALPPANAREYLENNARVFASGAAVECTETGIRADGTTGAYLTVKFPIRLADGETLLGGVALDITERHRAELALRDADRQKNAFLATLSHELRNPLAPLRTAAKLLADAALSPDQQGWARAVIERQVGQMSLLLDDLLEISRITQGKLELRRARIDLRDVVDEALETARPLIERKNHRLGVELPAEPLWIDADPLRLAQVLTNLLTNAAKYTDPDGRIELRARIDADEIVVAVEDTGIGLAPEALAAVFEMFAQVPGGRSRSEGGLGIGLALAKGIVELHGGSIAVASAGPGQGSTFTLRLPRVSPGAASPGVPEAERDARDRDRRRVLVADDNRDAADAIAMLLDARGHTVRVAYDGRAALALAQSFRPEACLLDVGMPGLDGYEVAAALRAQPWGAALLLVATTGWGQDEDKRRAAGAGFDHHLTKPVDPERVLALLAGGPRAQRPDAARARGGGAPRPQ